MLYLMRARVQKPESMSGHDFYSLWAGEAENANTSGGGGGVIKTVWKAAGEDLVVALFDVEHIDQLDRGLYSLPFWRTGHAHLVPEIEWTPLRDYAGFIEDLKQLAAA